MEPPKKKPSGGGMNLDDDDFETQMRIPAWHRPPLIPPNYGPKRKRNTVILPKSKVQHVLLHENKNQQKILSAKMSHLTTEFKRANRLFDLHKKSFLIRQSHKQVGLWEKGIDHVLLVPDIIVQLHCPGSNKYDAMQSPAARRMASLKQETKPITDINRKLKSSSNDNIFISRMKSYEQLESLSGEEVEDQENDVDAVKNFKLALVKLVKDKSNIRVDDVSRLKGNSPRLRNSDKTRVDQSITSASREKFAMTPKQILRREHTVLPHTSINDNDQWARSVTNNNMSTNNWNSRTGNLDRSKTAPGVTKSFATYKKYPRGLTACTKMPSFEDPRFERLKSQLIPPEKPIDTFIQLSPNGRKVIEKYGNALYSDRELNDLLEKYNDISFMSKRIQSEKMKKENKDTVFSAKDAFVDDGSLYSSLNNSCSSLILAETE